MVRKPKFLTEYAQIIGEGVYRPTPISRRGELYAYGFALSLGLATWLLRDQTGRMSFVGIFITGFFLIIGLVMSFGAWMDRGTRITVSAQRLKFKNPIRRMMIPSEKVVGIHAVWLRKRWKIAVFSAHGRMIFSTEFLEDKPGLVGSGSGLINGPMLAALIRTYAKLSGPIWQENAWTCEKVVAEEG